MVKLEKFEIILSRDNLIHFPGEEVSGNLIIKAKERLKINSLQLEFKGETGTHWCELKFEIYNALKMYYISILKKVNKFRKKYIILYGKRNTF